MLVRPRPESSWGTIAMSWKTSVARRALSRWPKLNAPVLRRLHDENGEAHFWQRGGGFDRDVRTLAGVHQGGAIHPSQPGRAWSRGAGGGVAMVECPMVDGIAGWRGDV